MGENENKAACNNNKSVPNINHNYTHSKVHVPGACASVYSVYCTCLFRFVFFFYSILSLSPLSHSLGVSVCDVRERGVSVAK